MTEQERKKSRRVSNAKYYEKNKGKLNEKKRQLYSENLEKERGRCRISKNQSFIRSVKKE